MDRPTSASDSAERPVIWALGISRLRDLFFDIVGEYEGRANVRVISRAYDDAVGEVQAAGAQGPDVVVAGGSNAAYLRTRIAVPVVQIGPTGLDVMHSLARARRLSSSVALVGPGETSPEVREFATAYGIDIVFGSYRTAQDAQTCVLDLRDRGVGCVVGPGLIADLAAAAGMGAVFLYSHASVRAAFDTALEVAQATRGEVRRRRHIDNLLQHLRDGVVALDAAGRVEAINRRLAAALGIDAGNAAGKLLTELAPDVAASLPDADGDVLVSIRGASYLVHRGPLAGEGDEDGAVLTFQESRAVERLDRTLRSKQLTHQFAARYRLEDVVGESASMERVRTLVRRYARSDATVLVMGESGTGKEMVAQSMHRLSSRRQFPFVAINCGAFPEALLESELFGYEEGAFTGARKGGKAGLIEAAHRGTLFLDEIGEMPLPLQSRLLRVLQEREVVRLGATEPTRVDIRVIAATHRGLTEGIANGTFRADLYYRLNILTVSLPPLRERAGDVMPLAAELLLQAVQREPRLTSRVRDLANAQGVLAEVGEPLQHYGWPGNVRELQNVIERIVVELADADRDAGGAVVPITAAALAAVAPELFGHGPQDAQGGQTLRERSRHSEADEIRAALAAFDGDRNAVCKALGISKTTLWRRLNGGGSPRDAS
ncbi:propionate catabolism operon regulatory protein PrpR [Trinickia caryophylli]|uniref:Transcriptional regulator, propionate catabolism operon regulatory protein n=1 Tax=Trinickia caryophylli TaxID=28094 RepID=A0A1X7D7K1_TRICW|nr:propionate catabolism operon regulatory protein PrpR [Trinickia caryophylli]PMS12636.1 propionate catabolism operon regulatory protein PrpR [Trinickia caryophylli]TRX15042.1 propionate catabolism operon regulatory protein PrpR [Trinickia caryophylli]WQE14901.1 propionate catabolism operon regulatory protein PrpR [Trinickia caryophylli]SMF10347.1 transcriptional regulator, propionate catabolism operon regulatory protein [Trinickia caryophylli]GLU31374.1 propionate catabolism operon regulator